MMTLKGSEKQVAWAEDIRTQVMDAAHEVYEGSLDQKEGLTFEQTTVGHTAAYAVEHMDEAKFWINAIGYAITDYNNRCEAAKCTSDLKGIITGMASKLGAEYYAEEDALRAVRSEAKKAAREARKAARLAAASK